MEPYVRCWAQKMCSTHTLLNCISEFTLSRAPGKRLELAREEGVNPRTEDKYAPQD